MSGGPAATYPGSGHSGISFPFPSPTLPTPTPSSGPWGPSGRGHSLAGGRKEHSGTEARAGRAAYHLCACVARQAGHRCCAVCARVCKDMRPPPALGPCAQVLCAVPGRPPRLYPVHAALQPLLRPHGGEAVSRHPAGWVWGVACSSPQAGPNPGILQGAAGSLGSGKDQGVSSGQLCSSLASATTRPCSRLLLRLVDDFLLVTPHLARAKAFLR